MHERLYEAFEKLRGANQTLFKVKQELAELKTKAEEDPSDGSVSGKLSKKEKEVEAVERKYNDLKTEMDTCAAALEPVRVFMETNLPYVKEVYDKLREEAAKSAMVKQWVGGGRTIRYEDVSNPAHGFAGLFGKPPVNTWKVKMPAFADIDGSDAASVNVDKVEAFVKSGELPIRSDNGFYVVLTVEAVPGAGGVPGAGAAPKTNALAKAKGGFDPIRQWKMFGRNIKYRDAATGVLSTKILPGGVVKVKMVDPKFASINGRDVSEPNFLKAVETLVTQKHLTPELDPALRRYVVVLDTESFLPPGIGNPAIAQWLADGTLVMCQDIATPAALFDKPLAAGTYKVKMTDPAFKTVNGRDVTKVRPEEIRKLVFSGKLVPQKNTSIKKYVVVLGVEK